MAKKIPYNKEKSGKQIGRGGPRDMQQRQAVAFERGTATIQLPSLNIKEELKRLLLEQKREEGPINVDLDGLGLTYEQAEKKIQQAVEVTRKEERERYESGLQNLNDQLNAAKKKIATLEESLADRIRDPNIDNQLKEKVEELNEVNLELVRVKAQLETKDEFLEKFINSYMGAVDELRTKMLELSGKIPEGEFNEVMKVLERPKIQENVFIDPIEKKSELDSHIKIKADATNVAGAKRNVKNDLAQLKNLLNKK